MERKSQGNEASVLSPLAHAGGSRALQAAYPGRGEEGERGGREETPRFIHVKLTAIER